MKQFKAILVLCLSATLFVGLFGCSKESQSDDFILQDDQTDGLWNYHLIDGSSYTTQLFQDGSYSVSIWLRAESNKPGTVLFSIHDDENQLILTSSGYNEGVYSGLTLQINENNWIVADGDKSLSTGRYNHLVLNVENQVATLFLNGESVAEGTCKLAFGNETTFSLGKDWGTVFSQLSIHSNVLSAEQVSSDFNSLYPSVLLDTLVFPEANDLQNNLWLVDNTLDGIPVNYQLEENPYMTSQGTLVALPDQDTTLSLTAQLSTSYATANKAFSLTIKASTDTTLLERDLIALDADLEYVMYSGQLLPDTLPNGSSVSFSLNTSEAQITDYHLTKQGSNSRLPLQLTASLIHGTESLTKEYPILLLDEIGGYILSYFNGDETAQTESGKLAYSLDGTHWTSLNQEQPILTSSLGTGRLRDPFVGRDKNGDFIILATEGYDNPNIYVLHSTDLVHFSEATLPQIAYYDAGLLMTGQKAWAPEFLYDAQKDTYTVYFSSTGFDSDNQNQSGYLYQVTTSDFETFSYPSTLFNPGYTVIDGTILRMNGQYWLFYKDERSAAQTIFYASSPSLDQGFTTVYDEDYLQLKKYMEGPFIVRNHENSSFILYIDNYPNGTFYAGTFTALGKLNDLTWLTTQDYTLPSSDVRHGSVIPVTQEELDTILAAY